MAHSFHRFALVVGTAIMFCAEAAALKPAPLVSWTQTSRDGRFVFVRRLSDELDFRQLPDEKAAEIRRLHADYPQTGLYRNDGSRRFLWELDKPVGKVEVASDGVHLIAPTRLARRLDDEALTFYASGRLLRVWLVRDVVSPGWRPIMEPYPTPMWFRWLKGYNFDEERMTFVVETEEGARLTFDVRTGEMVAREAPPGSGGLASGSGHAIGRRTPLVVAALAAMAALVVLVVALWRWRAFTRPAPPNTEPRV